MTLCSSADKFIFNVRPLDFVFSSTGVLNITYNRPLLRVTCEVTLHHLADGKDDQNRNFSLTSLLP